MVKAIVIVSLLSAGCAPVVVRVHIDPVVCPAHQPVDCPMFQPGGMTVPGSIIVTPSNAFEVKSSGDSK